MPLFILYAKDSAEGSARRPAARPAHLEYWSGLAVQGRLLFAGPMLSEPEGRPIGSLIIFEAGTAEAAAEIAKADPYHQQGVFASVEIVATQQVSMGSGAS